MRKEHGEGDSILLEQTQTCSAVGIREKFFDDNVDPASVVDVLCDVSGVPKNSIKNVDEVLQRKLVEVVDVVQLFQHGEDCRARSSNNGVLQGDVLYLGHDTVGLGNFGRDLRRFLLQRLQGLDDMVVI